MTPREMNEVYMFKRKLHPLPTFAYFVILLVMQMWTFNTFIIVAGYIASVICMCNMRGIERYLRKLPLDILVVAVCALINLVGYHDGEHILTYINNNAITLEAINFGAHMGVYFLAMVNECLIYKEILTEDEFLYLFGRIAPSASIMISQVFRTIPELKNDYKEITMAAEGLGSFGLKAKLRNVSTLISKSLEESIERGELMEDRGYGLGKRTSYHRFRARKRDFVTGTIVMAVGISLFYIVASGKMTIYFYPKYEFKASYVINAVVSVFFFIYALFPIILIKGVRDGDD